MNKEGVKTWN